jgi:predicted nucleotidyltransferase
LSWVEKLMSFGTFEVRPLISLDLPDNEYYLCFMGQAAFPESTKVETALLKSVVDKLVTAFSPEKVILFGSCARGDAQADSDFDLLVVARSSDPVHVRMAKAQRALRGVSMAVDVFVCTPEEVATYGSWLSHTIAVALREGTVVHARP